MQSPPMLLISSAQDFTASWADLGWEIDTRGADTVGLFVVLDINDSSNARVRALAKHTEGGEEYSLPIRTISSTDVKIDIEYIEFNLDADQNLIISFQLDNVVPFVQFQIQAGTVGATAGQVDDAHIVIGY